MEKPKIFVFTTSYHPFLGGAEIAVREVARRLKGRFDFYIVTARFRRDLPKREVREEGTVIRLGLGNRFDKWLLPLLVFLNLGFGIYNLPKYSMVLWGMDISQGSLAALFLKVFCRRVPFILTIQYGNSEERLSRGRFGLMSVAFRLMLSHADSVTAISRFLGDLASRFGYPKSVHVIYNGVDFETFRSRDKSFKKSGSTKTIITTSRLVSKNGIDVLIRAVAEVRKKIPNIRCIIVGDGPERMSLEKEAASLGVADVITFLGEVSYEKIPFYLHRADLFVRPSRSEGMGNSFVEALAAGLPVIGTAVGGITDIIDDARTGLFTKVDDSLDLSEKILILLKNEELYRRIKVEGEKMVRKRFSWDEIALSYESQFLRYLDSNSHLRVLVATGLFPPDIGGPATYSKMLQDELFSYDIEVSVASFGSVRRLPRGIRHLRYFLRLLRLGFRNHIIYAQDPVSVGFPAVLTALILRKKLILKIVGDYAWEQGVGRFGIKDLLDEFLKRRYGPRVELLRFIERWVALRAFRMVAPSYYLKSVIMQWGIPKDRIEVIPNSVKLPFEAISRETARSTFNLSGTVIVSVGRFVPWKGFETLIEIVPSLSSEIKDLNILLIGSGPEEEYLKSRVKALGLEERVRFIGIVPHKKIFSYFLAGDIFLLNTAYEGFPHTVLEAMAVGIPVITTKAGGNPEIVSHKKDGILVEFNNRDELKKAVFTLYRDSKFKNTLVENAKRKAVLFSKELMLRRTAEFMRRI